MDITQQSPELRKNPENAVCYIAHTDPDSERLQTVREHLEATARLAGEFAAAFGAETLGYRCGMLHDIGKYSRGFLERILKNGPRVDHSTAGAIEAFKLSDVFTAFCVSGHHGGLPDGGNRGDTTDDATLMGRVKRVAGKHIPDYSYFQNEIRIPEALPPGYLQRSMFGDAFFIRFLYSALVDADFLDTEAFVSDGAVQRGIPGDIAAMLAQLEHHIAPWWEAKTELNKKRCEVLRACLDAGKKPKGLYTLTVPTGGGKTVSSLAFALSHAKANGMRRVIYVIPYTNIIEQTVGVFSGIVGADQVLAHHSRVEYDTVDGEETTSALKKRLSAENWDAPLVVTTAVQFFESLFSNKSSRCRKLHNIAGSVLIFDEAQMMPVPYLRPCVAALSELAANYGCTVVLCTATQPSLGRLFKEVNPAAQIEEICTNHRELYEALRRVSFAHDGELSYEDLADRLNAEDQVLCIVNSREEAQKIYGLLEKDGSFHLSTLMTAFDRRRLLETIRQRLKKDLPCRVVSTSLVEAGVDLDFPAVYRAEAGLDSILQAAGRCNREGRKSVEQSVVHIFQAEKPVPKLFEQTAKAARLIMRDYPDFASPEAIQSYFEFLYTLKGDELDNKHIMDAWERGINGSIFPFATVAGLFQLIDTATKTVYIPLGSGEEYVRRFQNGERSRDLFRRAGEYAVEIYPYHYKALHEIGAIQQLDEGVAILADPGLYSAETGLALSVTAGVAKFA